MLVCCLHKSTANCMHVTTCTDLLHLYALLCNELQARLCSMSVCRRLSDRSSFGSPFFAGDTERISSKMGRTYLFAWFVVNFILTSSYTASLTTHLVKLNIEVSLPNINFENEKAYRALPGSLATCYKEDNRPCMAT